MSDCLKAANKQTGLQAELDDPTVIRMYNEQLELERLVKAASDKSNGLIDELRVHRRLTRHLSKRKVPT